MAISRLTEVEVASAVCRRCREGALSPSDRDRILERLARECQALLVVDLGTGVVDRARGLLASHRLRAGDAIQLASALVLADVVEAPMLFLCFDDALVRVARAVGLPVREPRRPKRKRAEARGSRSAS